MNSFTGFWYGMVGAFESAASALVIAGGLAGIAAVCFFAIFKLRKINAAAAIAVSTLAACLLMIPVISAFNKLVASRVEGEILGGAKAEIRAAQAEAALLRAENNTRLLERERLENQISLAKQSIEIEALNDKIKLLENSQVSMRSFEKILELALLQTNLKQTLVRKEPITRPEQGWGLRAEYYSDEALVVITHDISAKFGVDLNAIKIAKTDEDTVIVSGIRSKFIGASRNVSDTLVKEIRRLNFKKGVVSSIDVQNNAAQVNLANDYASRYEREFQTKLSEGLELGFMDDAVVQLARNFITVMFAPLYKNIRFDEAVRPGALPLTEHLEKELKAANEQLDAARLLAGED